MRMFIKQTLLFFTLLVFLIVLLDALSSSMIKSKANFKLNSNVKYIILGHSHPECAYNDSLIANFKNAALSGDVYFYNYYRAKQILSQNPSIKTVFIEYTNNQIEAINDSRMFGKESFDRMSAYPEFSAFLSASDKVFLCYHNPMSFINSFILSINTRLNRIYSKDYNFTNVTGGYNRLVRDKTDSLVDVAGKNNNSISKVLNNISTYNLKYLSLLVQLCKEKGKKVILVRSPIHRLWNSLINEKIYSEIRKRSFGELEFIDFSKFPLSNSEFGDFGHLNYRGAEKFSLWFDKMLAKGLLELPNKQEFIDGELSTLMCDITKHINYKIE